MTAYPNPDQRTATVEGKRAKVPPFLPFRNGPEFEEMLDRLGAGPRRTVRRAPSAGT